MGKSTNRPYFQYSIAQLETLFCDSQSDIKILQQISHEVTHRSTSYAARLRSQVTHVLTTLSAREAAPAGPGELNAGPLSAPAAAPAKCSGDPDRSRPPQSSPLKPGSSTETPSIPPIEPLGNPAVFPTPKAPNDPAGILAAWTALEALSPQTYRRSEDLAAGDRRCVADLSAGQMPWQMGERSRPIALAYPTAAPTVGLTCREKYSFLTLWPVRLLV